MKNLEKKVYTEKEISNIKKDATKLEDLAFLISADPAHPGPFDRGDQVKSYLDNQSINEKVKNHRLYIEIRYARNTSLSLLKV